MALEDTGYAIFETALDVRPDDIDMNGHVHSPKYFDYLLAARLDQMQRCYGMSIQAFIERNLNWFVRTAHIEHKRALTLGDSMRVRTSMSEIGKRTVTVVWEILRTSDNKVAAKGYAEYSLIDTSSGRATNIPQDIIDTYAK